MTVDEAVKRCLNDHTEDSIHERISEAMYDYVDDSDIEEHGDIYEAYSELGRGEAESAILRDVLAPFEKGGCELDWYCEVWDALCEEWNISTN